jgi:hypothetical protein
MSFGVAVRVKHIYKASYTIEELPTDAFGLRDVTSLSGLGTRPMLSRWNRLPPSLPTWTGKEMTGLSSPYPSK